MRFVKRLISTWFVVAMLATTLAAQTIPEGKLPEHFRRMEFKVDSVMREALVRVPASTQHSNAPVVFVFHGHGGNAHQAMRSFDIHDRWPEAIFVFMQGLNTPGQLTDSNGKRPGWQNRVGAQDDRDLKFFDAVFARLKIENKVDTNRVYCTGHSNGGGFTYLLWAERGDMFAAVAPSAAVAAYVNRLKPKPAMHLAGKKDSLVKFTWQERMMNAEKKLNGCGETPTPWGDGGQLYESNTGTPFVTLIHGGAHELHPHAGELIVKFFKEHPKQ